MRLIHIAALSAISLSSVAASAQVRNRSEPVGVRELRAHFLPAPFTIAWVAATDEGLVELVFDEGLARGGEIPRQPIEAREFFHAAEVLAWVDHVTALLERRRTEPAVIPSPTPALRRLGVVFEAHDSIADGGRRRLSFVTKRCRLPTQETVVDERTMAATAAMFRRAAMEARSIAPRVASDDAVWFEHAVGCPAEPRPENDAPRWPSVAAGEIRPHQELVQFVVGATGVVEPETARFLASSDRRFAASVREVLPTWRFEPARRMGRPVRQLVQTNVGFAPPVVLGDGAPSCLTSPGAAPRVTPCDSLFTVPLTMDVVSILPQGDGTIRIANAPETRGRHLIAGPPHTHEVVSGTALRRFVDSVAKLLPAMETDASWPALADREFAPGGPVLGAQDAPGLNMWLSGTGWIRAGVYCGHLGTGQFRFMEVGPREFPAFRQALLAAVDRMPLQPRWAPRGNRPYVEHELTCDVVRRGPVSIPSMSKAGAQRTSVELVARLVVDASGRVEPASVEVIPGVDSAARREATEALKTWTFKPALVGGVPVRAGTHVSLVIRPTDAGAVLLASTPPPPSPEDTLRRTVFFSRRGEPDRPMSATSSEAWREAIAAMQPFVEGARRTWPGARDRYLRGLPLAQILFVTVRLTDGMGRTEQIFVRVDRIERSQIFGRVESEIGTVQGWRRGDRIALQEAALIDWTILRPDGSEEGNVVGKFLDTYRPRRPG